MTFDWRLALPFRKGPFPLILAGGLSPDNVFNALETLQPYGVDVSSGVETGGMKDKRKIKLFMKESRRWESQQS